MYFLYMRTHVHVLNVVRSVASLQRMIYRLPPQTCHRRRLESSAVIPSILWMGTRVPCFQINRGTSAWNWLPNCHICHKAKKVIAQDIGEGCDFVLFWLGVKRFMQISIHLSIRASFCLFFPAHFPQPTCWFLKAPCFSFIELHIFTPRSFAVQLVFFCWLLSSCTRAGGG